MPVSRQKGYFAPNLKPKGMHLPKRIQERRTRASLDLDGAICGVIRDMPG